MYRYNITGKVLNTKLKHSRQYPDSPTRLRTLVTRPYDCIITVHRMWIKQGSHHRKHGWFTSSHANFNQPCPGLLNGASYLRDQFTSCNTLYIKNNYYQTSSNINPSGDFKDDQVVRNIDSLHPGQDMELFRMFLWNRKSRAFSREATGPFISSSRQKSTMSGIRIVVVFVDDGNW